MRSVNVGLGLPFNIASYVLLCKKTGFKQEILTGFFNNIHISKSY